MNLSFTNIFDNIIVSGDIHGDIMPLVNKINDHNKITNSLIIIAGDVGLGFHKDNFYLDLFEKAHRRLQKSNNILLMLRGNHDNPAIWQDNIIFQDYWQDGNKNIRLLKDYTAIQATSQRGAYNILCVGGAISIDRTHRIEGRNYWPNEPFVYDEDKTASFEGVTHIITHSCPDFCEPLTKGGISEWLNFDKHLELDCNKERNDHTLFYNKLREKNQLQRYYYGHYHYSSTTIVDEVMFRMLSIMELCEI